MLASTSPSFETRLTPLLRDEILYLHGEECGNAARLEPRGHRSSRRDSTQTEHARGKSRAASSAARGFAARLFAGPAVLGDRLAGIERGRASFGDFRVIEREVEQEQPVGVSASEVEAGPHHADFVADAHSAAAGEAVRACAVAVDLVAVTVVDDHGLAPAVDQALSAIEFRRKQ